MVRNAPVAIVVVDASGRLIYSNARARALASRQVGHEMPADLDGGLDIFGRGRTASRFRPPGSLNFLDPWGNHVQVVDYREIQFSKTQEVLAAMGLDGLQKPKGLDENSARRIVPAR